MTFNELYFIEGQSAQGHINPAVNPFLYDAPPVGYPNGIPTYPHIPITPLDLLQVVDKEKLDADVKEEKRKRRRKKLLKLMILSQMMNSNNK